MVRVKAIVKLNRILLYRVVQAAATCHIIDGASNRGDVLSCREMVLPTQERKRHQ